MDEALASPSATWTGLVRGMNANEIRCLAHGQQAALRGLEFEEGQTMMLYNVKKSFTALNASWTLWVQPESMAVNIPEETDVLGVKDVCAGMGGLTQGLEAVGFHPLAALEINPLMCETLFLNGHPGIVQGSVLRDLDRARFHCTPFPSRCTMASGFPCQPLSAQGDQRGQEDERSQPFHAVVKMAWQQCAALILENVKGARTAGYVQEAVQKLAWSLGMNIVQTYLQPSQHVALPTLKMVDAHGPSDIPDQFYPGFTH